MPTKFYYWFNCLTNSCDQVKILLIKILYSNWTDILLEKIAMWNSYFSGHIFSKKKQMLFKIPWPEKILLRWCVNWLKCSTELAMQVSGGNSKHKDLEVIIQCIARRWIWLRVERLKGTVIINEITKVIWDLMILSRI